MGITAERLVGKPEVKESWEYVQEYYITLTISMIGDLPIPGAATLSGMTGMAVGWILEEEDPWQKYAQEIAECIDEEIAGLETKGVENDLVTAEEEFDDLSRILDKQGWEVGQPLSSQLQNRFVTLIYNLAELRQSLFNPYSAAYTTFPYYDRLFTLYSAVLGTATITLDSYDTYAEFTELFEKSRDYLQRAVDSAIIYRTKCIKGKYGGWSNVSQFYDEQTNSYFSDKRPLGGTEICWDAYYALWKLLKVNLGYVYPNRLKIVAALQNFDKLVGQYNDYWSARKPDHVMIEPLWNDWNDEIQQERRAANAQRSTIDKGYFEYWSNGPGVHEGLYFSESAYTSHFHGPRLFKSGSSEGMYLPVTDYPKVEDVISIEKFDQLDLSPVYNVIVYSEEKFGGKSHTFAPYRNNKFAYPKLAECGFGIKSLKVVYVRGH